MQVENICKTLVICKTKTMKKHYPILILAAILALSCNKKSENQKINITPEPVKISMESGTFILDDNTKVCFINIDLYDPTVEYINEYFPKFLGFNPTIDNSSQNSICFEILTKENPTLGKEGYELKIGKDKILAQANTGAGLFYAFQTLFQIASAGVRIPCATIIDYPRFEWRGSHLDVCRHFFDVDFIKKHLDMLAVYKINKFHWHLTDDQGWRIQIDKYPKLTETGAWRVDRNDEPWEDVRPPQENEQATYGGFFSKEQIREIVQYANKRHIDVIPEIEMPGHSSAILASYPELSCIKEKDYVQPGDYWPPSAILCAGNDQTIQFLHDVFDEVIELFPYEYIHIGGDEAFKERWKVCEKCNTKMQELGFGNDYEALQGWLVKEVEKYLNTKGKKMIGWDEILDGGVSKNATIMSWRGNDGGIKAAKQGNFAVMTPTTNCYLDYYQADPDTQPLAIGGYVPLKKVYALEPVPEELTEDEEKYILGAQCNLWTEFIITPEHAEYMMWPRLIALAEVAWSQKEKKSWDNFKIKIEKEKERLHNFGYNFCEGNFKPAVNTIYKDGQQYIFMEPDVTGTKFYYTLDNSEPTTESLEYNKPIELNAPVTIKARAYYKEDFRESTATMQIIPNKLAGRNVEFSKQPTKRYRAEGEYTLFDGIRASNLHRDGRWLGFQTDNISITINNNGDDLNKIVFTNHENQTAGIHQPSKIEIFISDDGINYESKIVKERTVERSEGNFNIESILSFDNTVNPNFVKIEITGAGIISENYPFAGEMSWIFIDEIMFE